MRFFSKRRCPTKTLEFLSGGLNIPIKTTGTSWFRGLALALRPFVFH